MIYDLKDVKLIFNLRSTYENSVMMYSENLAKSFTVHRIHLYNTRKGTNYTFYAAFLPLFLSNNLNI